jgi:hypothetical protein
MPEFREVEDWDDVDSCPVCGEQENTEKLITNFNPVRPTVHWDICNNCSHLYANPQPSQDWLANYYKEGYREDTHGLEKEDPEEVPQSSGQEEVGRGVKILNSIERIQGGGPFKRHLDLGSSTGALIAGVMEKWGVPYSVGVEPNDAWRQFSMNSFDKFKADGKIKKFLSGEHEFKTYEKLEDVPKSPKFDLITASHVIEHLPDPLATMTRLRKNHALSKATLYVEVPFALGGVPDSLMFPHIHCFTPETITTLLENAGWHIESLEMHGAGIPPFFPSPQHISVIANAKEVVFDKDYMLRRYNQNRGHSKNILEAQSGMQQVYEMG